MAAGHPAAASVVAYGILVGVSLQNIDMNIVKSTELNELFFFLHVN